MTNHNVFKTSVIIMLVATVVIAEATGFIHVGFYKITVCLTVMSLIYLALDGIYSKFEVKLRAMESFSVWGYLFKDFRRILILSIAMGVSGIRESLVYVLVFFAIVLVSFLLGRFIWFFISKDRIFVKEQRYLETINEWERLPENDKDVLLGMFKGSEKAFKHISGLLSTPDKNTPTEILTLIQMWHKIPVFAKQKFINDLSSKGASKAVSFLEGIGKV